MADERVLHVEVVTPDGEVYSEDVAMVVLPGIDGDRHHAAPLPRTAALQHLHVKRACLRDRKRPDGGIGGPGPEAEGLLLLGRLVPQHGSLHRGVSAVQRHDAVIGLGRGLALARG